MKRIVLISLVAVAFVACQDGTSPRDSDFEGANFDIFDGLSTGGNRDFFFLPPLTSQPRGPDVGDRPANALLEPFARICQLNFGDGGTPAPPTLECVGGNGDGENIGQVANLAMTFQSGGFYKVGWNTGDPNQTGGGLDPNFHFRIEIFVGTVSLGYRDVDPDDGPPKGRCRREDFCQFNNGSNLQIKTIIESGAFCLIFGGDPDNCATATVPPGGTVELAGVATATPDQGGTLNLQPCPDLRDIEARPTPLLGRFDGPTFGECIEIIPLDPDLTGIATICNPFTPAELLELTEEQIRRMTVLRHSAGDAFAVALAHAADPGCALSAPAQARELNRLERFVRFARNTWRAVSDRVVAWIEPAPLFARTMFRCNRGGCSGPGDFRSDYQVGQLPWIDFDPGEDGNFGAVLVGTELSLKVNAMDSGELPTSNGPLEPVPEPVEGVRLTFFVLEGGSFSAPAVCVGGDFCVVETDAFGEAEVTLTVVLGSNTVGVAGIGVGTDDLDGGFLNVFGPSINDPGADPVELGIGQLRFNATGIN